MDEVRPPLRALFRRSPPLRLKQHHLPKSSSGDVEPSRSRLSPPCGATLGPLPCVSTRAKTGDFPDGNVVRRSWFQDQLIDDMSRFLFFSAVLFRFCSSELAPD